MLQNYYKSCKKWIKDFVEKQEGLIDGSAIDKLIEWVGNDLWRISNELKNLIATTKTALDSSIKEIKIGKTFGDIGFAIMQTAKKNGFSIAEGLTGHGIGKGLHEDPYVLNFGEHGKGEVVEEGMVFAIEPMFIAGNGAIRELLDGSYAAKDGSYAAHFEHTVAVTKKGARILTQRPNLL